MREVVINSVDDYKLNVHLFEVSNPKGCIQIIHGMEEYQERYEKFALFLNNNGYNVITSDMRGHGRKESMLGYFKDKDGYKLLIKDQIEILKFIKNEYNTDVFLFAHSMGSIIARNILMNYSNEYKKCILCGYPNPNKLSGVAIMLSGIVKMFKGGKHKSKLIESLSIGQFNKCIKNPKTNLDWLSYSDENINNYINDPYCGFGFTTSAFNDLFHLTKNMGNKKNYKNVNNELKLLLIAGSDDPATGFDKGKKSSLNMLKKAGFVNINVIDYEKMRHEILNEEKYLKVYYDVLNFIDKVN